MYNVSYNVSQHDREWSHWSRRNVPSDEWLSDKPKKYARSNNRFAPIEKTESFRWKIKKKYHRADKAPHTESTFQRYYARSICRTFSGKTGTGRCIWREWFRREVNRAEFTIAQHPIHMAYQSLTMLVFPSQNLLRARTGQTVSPDLSSCVTCMWSVLYLAFENFTFRE